MRVMLAGSGLEIEYLLQSFIFKKYDVTILSKDKNFLDEISFKYDVDTEYGEISSVNTLKNCNVGTFDIFVSLSNNNEKNILAASLAKNLGATHVLAKVDDYGNGEEIEYIKTKYNINSILDSDLITSDVIVKMIEFPTLRDIKNIKNIGAIVLKAKIKDKAKIKGKCLKDIKSLHDDKVIVLAILRNKDFIIPNGETMILEDDCLVLSGEESNVFKFLEIEKIVDKTSKNILLIGGGKLGNLIISRLLNDRRKVTLIEKNKKRCKELNHRFENLMVLEGDGGNIEFLEGLHIEKFDAVISSTSSDETDLSASVFAKSRGVSNIVAELDSLRFREVLRSFSIDGTVSSAQISAEEINNYIVDVYHEENDFKGTEIIAEYNIVGKIHAYQFIVAKNFKLLDLKLSDKNFKLKEGTRIGLIYRDNTLIVPNGSHDIKVGDKILVITNQNKVRFLNDLVK